MTTSESTRATDIVSIGDVRSAISERLTLSTELKTRFKNALGSSSD